jgi:hypothetical protein
MSGSAAQTGEGIMPVAMTREHKMCRATRPDRPTITSRDTRIARA